MKLTSGVAQRSRRERAVLITKLRIVNWDKKLQQGITTVFNKKGQLVKVTSKLAQANKELINLENRLSNGY